MSTQTVTSTPFTLKTKEDLARGRELVPQPPSTSLPVVFDQPIEFPLGDMLATVVESNRSALNALSQSNQLSQRHIAEQQQTIEQLLAENASLQRRISSSDASHQRELLLLRETMQSTQLAHQAEKERLQAQTAALQQQIATFSQQLQTVQREVKQAVDQLDKKHLSHIVESAHPKIKAAFQFQIAKQKFDNLEPRVDQTCCDLKVLLAQLETLQAQMRQ